MWEPMVVCIQRSAKEILGTSRRGGSRMKGPWWWNEEVKEKVKEKKEAYIAFVNSGTDEEKEISKFSYKAAKKVAKKAVALAKSMTYDRLYQKQNTKEREKELFKLTSVREKKIRDLGVVMCIKDENGEVLYVDAVMKERWQRYIFELLNGEVMQDFQSTERESSESHLYPLARTRLK